MRSLSWSNVPADSVPPEAVKVSTRDAMMLDALCGEQLWSVVKMNKKLVQV